MHQLPCRASSDFDFIELVDLLGNRSAFDFWLNISWSLSELCSIFISQFQNMLSDYLFIFFFFNWIMSRTGWPETVRRDEVPERIFHIHQYEVGNSSWRFFVQKILELIDDFHGTWCNILLAAWFRTDRFDLKVTTLNILEFLDLVILFLRFTSLNLLELLLNDEYILCFTWSYLVTHGFDGCLPCSLQFQLDLLSSFGTLLIIFFTKQLKYYIVFLRDHYCKRWFY